MRYFYKFLLAWTELDLMIARSTGRNPAHISTLIADRDRWSMHLFLLENSWK